VLLLLQFGYLQVLSCHSHFSLFNVLTKNTVYITDATLSCTL